MPKHIALTILLLTAGCSGQFIREDRACDVVPRGTAEIVERALHPGLQDFIHSLRFNTFDDTGKEYGGYYCPLRGVVVARRYVGRMELAEFLVHEILHGIYSQGLVDGDAFALMLRRLREDPRHRDFVSPVETGFGSVMEFVYLLTETNEYFARIGEEIVKRRGMGVPDYVWAVYRGILHPNIEANGRHPDAIAKWGKVFYADGSSQIGVRVVSHALGLPSIRDACQPRRDVTGMAVQVDTPFDFKIPDARTVLFYRRSTGATITTCSGAPMLLPDGQPRLQCSWDAAQARAIMKAWEGCDLEVRALDPPGAVASAR